MTASYTPRRILTNEQVRIVLHFYYNVSSEQARPMLLKYVTRSIQIRAAFRAYKSRP